MNVGLTNLYITCIAISGGSVYAGTLGGGIFSRMITEGTGLKRITAYRESVS